MVINLSNTYVSILIFETLSAVARCGSKVRRANLLTSVPVSMSVFGRAIDALGGPLDGKGKIKADFHQKVDTKAIGIIPRESVREPMQTGVVAIDALTPVGCGQRELIIGDRQTGKTAVALDAIISQLLYNTMYCIYVAVGQKKGSIAKIYNLFFNASSIYKEAACKRLLLVVSSSADSAVLQYLAPYSGCTIGE